MKFNIGKLEEFPQGSIKEISIQGKPYAISNTNGILYAIDGICTHAGGKINNGHLVGKIVTCPRHGAQFDVTTGSCIRGPRIGLIKLKAKDEVTYEVKVESDSVKVKL